MPTAAESTWVGLAPVQLPEPAVLVSMVDVTARAEAQRLLAHANEALEERVAARTESLVRSNHDLERFAYVASHDLREPLRMISSYTGLLEEELADGLNEEQHLYMGFVTDGARRMQQLLDDLLSYARIASTHHAAPAACSGDAALDAALHDLGVALSQSDAIVEREPLPRVAVEQVRLARVFQNLVGNAIKFAKPGEAPHIHIAARTDGDQVEITVADRGIGFDMRHADDVFLLFRRVHARNRAEGTGLGLAITKRIVEDAGGTISVTSAPNEGTTFRLRLPAVSAPG
ncbi:MAG: ATP-binding protein [Myxococcota bacterium]